MKIKFQAMGSYQTNCYILSNSKGDIIIDPGMGASSWVRKNVSNPVAILNTHGHFDHVWSNDELSRTLGVPIYCPRDDVFMLENDIFGHGTPPSRAEFQVKPDEEVELLGLGLKFWHFPGHTPGCSAIEVGDCLFSGDFLFKGSIGRFDFPYSNSEDMKKSIKKAMAFQKDLRVYPGHGESTSLKVEQKKLPTWLRFI
ncbi:MAG: MBL fold metallo-hydrolase [Proteobacteria bacterium]|nr:MAG: MBL fold metallo-hydrolase [Pseudomonadota bacterium]